MRTGTNKHSCGMAPRNAPMYAKQWHRQTQRWGVMMHTNAVLAPRCRAKRTLAGSTMTFLRVFIESSVTVSGAGTMPCSFDRAIVCACADVFTIGRQSGKGHGEGVIKCYLFDAACTPPWKVHMNTTHIRLADWPRIPSKTEQARGQGVCTAGVEDKW